MTLSMGLTPCLYLLDSCCDAELERNSRVNLYPLAGANLFTSWHQMNLKIFDDETL